MLTVEIFYGVFWVSAISVVWFCTDWFIYYSQLFNFAKITRLEYEFFIKQNPNKYFPDFLFEKSLDSNNRFKRFMYKMLSCPFCLMAWLSLIASFICSAFIIAAPVYVISLFILLQIKKMF